MHPLAVLITLALVAGCRVRLDDGNTPRTSLHPTSMTPTSPTPPSAPEVVEVVAPVPTMAPTAWGTCDGRTPHGGAVHRLAPCPEALVSAVARWRPEALVALGGGILGPSRPACSTVQRGKLAAQLFAAIQPPPWLVLSGGGPPEPARALSPREATCVRERLRQESSHPDAPRAVLSAESQALAARGVAALTEADYLCEEILDACGGSPCSDTALARMLFEPRSESTIENAQRASGILRTNNIRRAVLVTSPVVREGREVDNHARRALGDFQHDRACGLHHSLLGAVGCPDLEGGTPWSAFEGRTP